MGVCGWSFGIALYRFGARGFEKGFRLRGPFGRRNTVAPTARRWLLQFWILVELTTIHDSKRPPLLHKLTPVAFWHQEPKSCMAVSMRTVPKLLEAPTVAFGGGYLMPRSFGFKHSSREGSIMLLAPEQTLDHCQQCFSVGSFLQVRVPY